MSVWRSRQSKLVTTYGTSRCDWRIDDLISNEHPVSLYLDGSDGIARRQKLLLMLDEFPALGWHLLRGRSLVRDLVEELGLNSDRPG